MAAREDAQAAAVTSFQSGVVGVVQGVAGVAFDAGVASVPPSTGGGGFTQADIDAAVAAQKSTDDTALQAKSDADAQAIAGVQQQLSDAQTQVASVSKQLVDMTTKEQSEEAINKGLVTSLDQIKQADTALQAVVAALAAILPQPPAPPQG